MSIWLALGTLFIGLSLYLHAIFREGEHLVEMEIYFGWVTGVAGLLATLGVMFGLL